MGIGFVCLECKFSGCLGLLRGALPRGYLRHHAVPFVIIGKNAARQYDELAAKRQHHIALLFTNVGEHCPAIPNFVFLRIDLAAACGIGGELAFVQQMALAHGAAECEVL